MVTLTDVDEPVAAVLGLDGLDGRRDVPDALEVDISLFKLLFEPSLFRRVDGLLGLVRRAVTAAAVDLFPLVDFTLVGVVDPETLGELPDLTLVVVVDLPVVGCLMGLVCADDDTLDTLLVNRAVVCSFGGTGLVDFAIDLAREAFSGFETDCLTWCSSFVVVFSLFSGGEASSKSMDSAMVSSAL